MRTRGRKAAALAGLAVVVCASAVPTAVATPGAGDTRTNKTRTVHVEGRQIPVDVAQGQYLMRGDLVGAWSYIPRTPPLHSSDTLYVEAGTEVFTGCIDRNRNGRCGRRDYRGELRLAFLYWASFDANGKLIKGQCVHPVTGGSGAFAGARGLLTMVDRPVGDEVRTTYQGDIVLNAVPSEAGTTSGASTTTPATAGGAAVAGTSSRSRSGC